MNITFSPLNKNIKINEIKKAPVSFCGLKSLKEDIFRLSSDSKVNIKDINGRQTKAVIKEKEYTDSTKFFGSNPKQLTINVDGKELGHMIFYTSKDNNSLFIKELFTEEDYNRHYKGAGTELLKCAVKESKKRGLRGQISLTASHCPPPFVFYYKNNFKVYGNAAHYNAAIDYAIRKNIPVFKVMPSHQSALPMFLDEKGANAFLKGERLYEKRNFKTIDERELKGHKVEANLIESPDGDEHYLQIISTDSKETKQHFVARGIKAKDEDGIEYLKFFNVDDCYAQEYEIKYAQKMADKMAHELGLQKGIITEEYIRED